MQTIRWQADAGIGDNFERLLRPELRRAWNGVRFGELRILTHVFGMNRHVLTQLYEPMGPLVQMVDDKAYFALTMPGTEVVPADWPTPKFPWFNWQPDEMTMAATIVVNAPRPWLMIQEVGGTHDGLLRDRKCWGTERWQQLIEWWKTSTGGSAFEFGPQSSLHLPCIGNIRVATYLASLMDLVVSPESALKYAGPMFNQRTIVLWSQFHHHTVEEQWRTWYRPFDRESRGLVHILGIGRTDCKETPVAEVIGHATQLLNQPRSTRKIALATAVWNRKDLAVETLRRVSASVWPLDTEFAWHLQDDASIDGISDYLRANQTILGMRFRGPTTVVRNMGHLGCDRTVVASISRALELYQPTWVCTVDSDVVVHPEWMERACQALDWAEARGIPIYALGIFNSRMHLTGEELWPGVVRKGSLGGACTLIRADILRELQLERRVTDRWGNGEPGWDWKVCDGIRERGGIIAALSPCYAQHVGRSGAHAGTAFDDAADFVGV